MLLAEPSLFFSASQGAEIALVERQWLMGCWPRDLWQLLFGGPFQQQKLFVADVGAGISGSDMKPMLAASRLDQRSILDLAEMWR